MNKDKLKIGQKLYSLNVGNASRNTESKLTPVLVTKVGRKYFTCCPEGEHSWQENQYYIDTWLEKSDYSANSVLYSSTKEWEDEKESSRICSIVSDEFKYRNHCSIPLSQLKIIERIIKESKHDSQYSIVQKG